MHLVAGGISWPALNLTRRLDALRAAEWVVYAKRPLAGPEQVLAYLARYTHRVALANSRLTRLTDGQVDFIVSGLM